MDCPFNFCDFVVGLIAARFFDVNKTTIKICRNKNKSVTHCSSLNKHATNTINFVYFIRVIICQHCVHSDINIICLCTFLKDSAIVLKLENKVGI